MLRRMFLSSLLVVASLPVFAASQKYAIDPDHTQVRITWNHFGFSNPSATFENPKGVVMLDSADLTKSSVSVSMPLSGLHTGVAELDEHLQGPAFFDAAKYPDITFNSTKVEKAGTDELKVTGDLSIHGVTHPVTLQVHINKIGDNPMTKTPGAGFDAQTTLKRSDFGIGAYVPNVSDAIGVHITLDSHLVK